VIRSFAKATILALAALSASAAVNCSSNSTKSVPSGEIAENNGTVGLQLQIAPGVTISSVNYTVTGPGGFTQTGSIAVGDSTTINAVLSGQQTAWNRGDVDAFLEGYWRSPELTFSGSSGVARGWDAVRTRYKKNYPDTGAMGQLDFSELEFRFLGPQAALALGRWHLKREKGDVGGVFTLVWQRFPDGWKIIHDHTSAVIPTKLNP